MTYYMTAQEVADYLRVNLRTVYGLAGRDEMPCSRATGKLLFPKDLIDSWVESHISYGHLKLVAPPPIVGGSSDPLLEWALRESGSGLDVQPDGSTVGLERMSAGKAVAAGIHLGSEEKGDDSGNIAAIRNASASDLVLIHWAWRQQGVVLPPDNPKNLKSLKDIVEKQARFIPRQEGAGTQLLFHRLMVESGYSPESANVLPEPALTQTDVALAILDNSADAGFAVESVARRFKLTFVPLHRERFDIACRRRSYFEPPLQKLFALSRSDKFRDHANSLGGYDIEKCGEVLFNR